VGGRPVASVAARMENHVPVRADEAGVEHPVTADDGFVVQADFESGATGCSRAARRWPTAMTPSNSTGRAARC